MGNEEWGRKQLVFFEQITIERTSSQWEMLELGEISLNSGKKNSAKGHNRRIEIHTVNHWGG